jgi:hypothetical protein
VPSHFSRVSSAAGDWLKLYAAQADIKICSVLSNSELGEEKLVSNRQSAPFVVATPIVGAPSNLAETGDGASICN